MKTKTPLSALNRFLIAIAALLAANMSALAGDLYWDANGSTGGTGGTGTWTTASTWRTNTSTGTLVTWPNSGNNNAFFEGTAGTVTIGSTAVTLGTGTAFFNTNGYTLSTDASTTTRTLTGNISIGSGLTLNFRDSANTTANRALNVGGNISGGTFAILGDQTGNNTARINISSNNSVVSSAIVLSNSSTGNSALVATASGVGVTGTINLAGGVGTIGATSGNGITLSDTAVISGSGTLMFAAGSSGGAGTVTINSQSTYTGRTIFNASSSGVIRLGTNNALGTNGADMAFSSGNGGIFDLNGFNQTFASISSGIGGSGSIRNNGASTSTLTINGDATNTTFGLVISNGSNPIAFAKSGSGTITLSGANTYTGGTTLSGGRITLSNTGTLGGSAGTVTVSGGLLNLGGSTTVTNASLTLSGGTVTNGTFNAPIYLLQGGTVEATLAGSGAATNSAGTTTLNGTLGTTNLVVSGGTINLGSDNRLDNSMAVSISSGTLGMSAFNDTVGSFLISGGTLGGSGTLTASTYALQGGTLTANLGAGAATVTTGTTALNGALAASTVDVASGTLTAGSAGRFTGTPTVTVSNGATLNLVGNETFGSLAGAGSVSNSAGRITAGGNNSSTTFSGVLSGAGELTKTGIGRLSLSGSSSYNGATAVSAGELNLSGGSIANSAVTVASGASLSGYGSVGTIGGAGAINPGNSPGILTTPQVNPSAGTTFNFEMTGTSPTYSNAASSVNDVIQITGATPFSQALTASNSINIYFSGAALFNESPKTITGGFFTDQSASLAGFITNATYNYYFADASGTTTYNGARYYTMNDYESLVLSTNMVITISTVAQTADFASGVATGQIMQVQVVPEPSTYALLGLSAAAFGAYRWRRRRRG